MFHVASMPRSSVVACAWKTNDNLQFGKGKIWQLHHAEGASPEDIVQSVRDDLHLSKNTTREALFWIPDDDRKFEIGYATNDESEDLNPFDNAVQQAIEGRKATRKGLQASWVTGPSVKTLAQVHADYEALSQEKREALPELKKLETFYKEKRLPKETLIVFKYHQTEPVYALADPDEPLLASVVKDMKLEKPIHHVALTGTYL